MIQVMNYMLEEEVLSEFAELVKKGIQWSLKSLIGIVIGVNVVQGLLGPAMDTLKKSAWTKSLTAIPGIGNTFGSVADVIFGTAVLIKNGIGMAGAIVIVGIFAGNGKKLHRCHRPDHSGRRSSRQHS